MSDPALTAVCNLFLAITHATLANDATNGTNGTSVVTAMFEGMNNGSIEPGPALDQLNDAIATVRAVQAQLGVGQ